MKVVQADDIIKDPIDNPKVLSEGDLAQLEVLYPRKKCKYRNQEDARYQQSNLLKIFFRYFYYFRIHDKF